MRRILHKPTKDRNVGRRSVKWIVRFMSTAGLAVVAYLVLSLFFDTPIEYELKKSTRLLEKEYEQLTEKYDTLNSVLENVMQRDKNIYKMIFESEPFANQEEDQYQRRTDLNARLLSMTNKELGDEFMERNSLLYQRVHNQQGKKNLVEEYVAANRDMINSIPSIQPVTNPDLTLLTASFGNRIQPFYKSMNFHQGVDYSVPVGTAVFATADGFVMQIDTRGQATGVSVMLAHDKGYRTFYANLDRVMVPVGSKVNRGDIIGFSGNSGLSYAPHLHYEVRHNGTPVDPLGFFFLELDMDQYAKIRQIARTGMQSLD